MEARDIMTKSVIAVAPDMLIGEAADLLMRYRIQITANGAVTPSAVETLDLRDVSASSISLNNTYGVFVSSTTQAGVGTLYDSNWVDLMNGLLASATNDVLTVNLSVTLTSGVPSSEL